MRFLAILFCFLPFAAHSQEKVHRTCRILFLGAGSGDPEKLYLHDGTKAREVELPRMNLSPVYEMPGGAITVRMLAAPPAEGQPVASGAPAAAVAEGMGAFYLLVTPDPANKVAPVRMQVIDASADRFKAGQMLWYNLTADDVSGQVGKQKLALKARSRVIIDAPATTNEDYNVNLTYRPAGKSTVEPLCETRWNHVTTARTVLFVINEPGSRLPRVLGFPDHPEEAGKDGGKNP